MIAMAVAGAPALIVADEPTTALDVSVQGEILRLLSDLRDKTGFSILFVTHDLAVAASLADRVAVLYGGRLAEVGPTKELLRQPDHPYTAGLVAARPSPDSLGAGPSRSFLASRQTHVPTSTPVRSHRDARWSPRPVRSSCPRRRQRPATTGWLPACGPANRNPRLSRYTTASPIGRRRTAARRRYGLTISPRHSAPASFSTWPSMA
jgi:ABC-type dipeptide/oligopeptide/nickel transport system ATPase component